MPEFLTESQQYDRRQRERKPWQPKRREEDGKVVRSTHISAKEEEAWARLDNEIARIQMTRNGW